MSRFSTLKRLTEAWPRLLAFDLENGRWVIVTGDYFINLPKDAPDLMAGMSETIEEEGNDKVD